jgi:hypothetical protein
MTYYAGGNKIGYSMLDARCSMLDARYWMLDEGSSCHCYHCYRGCRGG